MRDHPAARIAIGLVCLPVGLMAAASISLRTRAVLPFDQAGLTMAALFAAAFASINWFAARRSARREWAAILSRCAIVVLIGLVVRSQLPSGPRLTWRSGDDPARGATVGEFPSDAWGRSIGVIELHAAPPHVVDAGFLDSRAVANIPPSTSRSPLQVALRVTQPEWSVIDPSTGSPYAGADGVWLVFRGRRDGAWRELDRLVLDPFHDPAQRGWSEVTLNLDARDDALSIDLDPRANNWNDRVWVAACRVSRAFGPLSSRAVLWTCDLAALALFALAVLGRASSTRRRSSNAERVAGGVLSAAEGGHSPSSARSQSEATSARAGSNALEPERICDYAVIAFALWTVCCHVSVACGASLDQLLTAFVIVIGAAIAGRLLLFNHASSKRTDSVADAAPIVSPPRTSAFDQAARLLAMVIVVAGVAFNSTGGSVLVTWWTLLIALLLGVATQFAAKRHTTDDARPSEPTRPSHAAPQAVDVTAPRNLALWFMALTCAVLALLAHRPDDDDAYYVGVAVAAADDPSAALLATDPLHAVPGLAMHMPANRAQSLEMLNAAVARVTGIPALYSFHLITAALAAFLMPLALAVLFRRLLPRSWTLAVFLTLVVLVCAADAHRWYGNFAIVRIWQGKAIFLSVMVPLIISYSLRFSEARSVYAWTLLGAAQIAAVGLTTSALAAAPLLAIATLLSAVRDRTLVRTLVLGALSSAYIVVVGLVIRGQLASIVSAAGAPMHLGDGLSAAFDTVLGVGALRWLSLGAIGATWCVLAHSQARRFATVVPLVILLGPLNPYLENLTTRFLTGPAYWRATWALPLPILIALLLSAPAQFSRSRSSTRCGNLLVVALAAAFALFIPAFGTLSRANGTRITLPGPKLHPQAYEWALRVAHAEPTDASVLVPRGVAVCLPTISRHPAPLAVREAYLRRIRAALGDAEADLRWYLTGLVSRGPGPSPPASLGQVIPPARTPSARAAAALRFGLSKYALSAVCLSMRAERAAALRTALTAAGLHREFADDHYELWLRAHPGVERPE